MSLHLPAPPNLATRPTIPHKPRMPATPLRIGLVGAGHFGRYHALKLKTAPCARLSGVHDHNPDHAQAVAAETATQSLSLAALLEASDAIIVAVPAAAHHPLAKAALIAGKHVLVEKPIAATLHEADELAAIASDHRLILQVGHLERFSAAYQAMTAHPRRPLYIEATRIAPYKPRGTDVSVILDLMIHDLDLILALTDSPIETVDAIGAAIASAHEDIANARIRFASGAVATITASRVATRTERRMRIFADTGYMTVDFANRRLTTIRRGHGQALPGLDGFGIEETTWQDHDALQAEQAAFIASILDGAPVAVDAAAGRRALAAALAVTDAMALSRKKMAASGLIQQLQHGIGRGF